MASEICTDCGELLWTSEEAELGVCDSCLQRIRKEEGRCQSCGEYKCRCAQKKEA